MAWPDDINIAAPAWVIGKDGSAGHVSILMLEEWNAAGVNRQYTTGSMCWAEHIVDMDQTNSALSCTR